MPRDIVQTPFTSTDGAPPCADCGDGQIVEGPVTVGIPIPGPPGEVGPQGPPGPAGPGGEGSCPVYCGTGSPEGVVTALVGSLYYQRDALTTTHPQWVKRSGSSDTGWVAYAGHRGAGTQSLAIGDESEARDLGTIALGYQANAEKEDSIAIGTEAHVNSADYFGSFTGLQGIAIGARANNHANSPSVAIGNYAWAVGNREGASEVIGANAVLAEPSTPNYVFNSVSYPIGGYGAPGEYSRGGMYSVVLGTNAHSGGDCSVAVGYDTYAWNNYCVAVGTHARALMEGCVAVGRWSVSRGLSSTAVGFYSEAIKDHTVAVGNAAKSTAENGIAIGYAPVAGGVDSIAIGTEAKSLFNTSVVIGPQSISEGEAGVAIGKGATVGPYSQGIAIGTGALSDQYDAVAVGPICLAQAEHAVCMGLDNVAYRDATSAICIGFGCFCGTDGFDPEVDSDGREYGIAIGCVAYSYHESSIAIGTLAESDGYEGVALGAGTTAFSDGSLAVGTGANATDLYATALGAYTEATGAESIALGDEASANADYSMGLGFDSSAIHEGSIALGARSVTSRVNQLKVGSATFPLHATISGGIELPIRLTAVPSAITLADYTILVTGTTTVTLPTAVGIIGRVYVVKNTGVATVTVQAQVGQTIDGAASKILAVANEVVRLQSTGAVWVVI